MSHLWRFVATSMCVGFVLGFLSVPFGSDQIAISALALVIADRIMEGGFR